MKLVSHWRLMWRAWSVRLNAIGLAVMAWVQFDPVSALGVWNMMPVAVREVLPTQFLALIGMVLFALSMIAKFVRQPRLEEKRDAAAAKD